MKYFITGAAGFLGTNLVLKLLEDGKEVIGVDSLVRRGSEKNLDLIKSKFPNFKFYLAEIEDIPSIIYKELPAIIYHFAAQVAVTSSLNNPERDFLINALGTFRIANVANNLNLPIIYTSTNKVFGDNVNKIPIKELPTRYDFAGDFEVKGINETFPIDAKHHTPYGCSKLVGDIYIREFGGISNRCSCMYGKYQNGIVDQGWISHIARQIINGDKIKIYGNGKQVRDVLHADDAVDLLIKQGEALLSGREDVRGEAFNIGGGYKNTISLIELCNKWKVNLRDVEFCEWRPADQRVFYCDISKAKKFFNWEPKINIDIGLEDLFQWTKRNM